MGFPVIFFTGCPLQWDAGTSTITMIIQNYKANYSALQLLCWHLGSESIPKHQKSEWVATSGSGHHSSSRTTWLHSFHPIKLEWHLLWGSLVSILGLLRFVFLKHEHKLSYKTYFWYNLSLQWATLSYHYYFSCTKQRRFVKIGMIFPLCCLTFSSSFCSDSTQST